MKQIDIIYLIKVALGALTAIICILLSVNDIVTGISIGLMVYLLSDRLLKQIFIEKVEPSVIIKTGVGIYILVWIVLWILIYTFLQSYSFIG